VGICLVVFGEVAPIFIQAQGYDILLGVKWSGSDGSAQNIKIIKNTDAAFFVVKLGLLTRFSEMKTLVTPHLSASKH
jgi:hypothetical protein